MLQALSPIDGRYADDLAEMARCFSEMSLIKSRITIECEWVRFLSSREDIVDCPAMTGAEDSVLRGIQVDFSTAGAERVKDIEKIINHDVKAVELYLTEQFTDRGLEKYIPWIHFACTSEDINSVAYGCIIKRGLSLLTSRMRRLEVDVKAMAMQYHDLPMLSRTHGQSASPTTFGKELAVFMMRMRRRIDQMSAPVFCKFSGAVGNYNAHYAAMPNVNWPSVTKIFIRSFGLHQNSLTTQIEPHDTLAEVLDTIAGFNSILINFNRDMWHYISLGYLTQKQTDDVGSSVMPHKVNPIDFENSEGNCGIANALLRHLSQTLPISRLQRDLTDSTAMRNVGVAFAHSALAIQSTIRGLERVMPNKAAMEHDLQSKWWVLSEAVQTILRRGGNAEAYNVVRSAIRNHDENEQGYYDVIESLPLSSADRDVLLQLTPRSYLGLASSLTVTHAK